MSRRRCGLCDEWYEVWSPSARAHDHPEPQSSPPRDLNAKPMDTSPHSTIDTPAGIGPEERETDLSLGRRGNRKKTMTRYDQDRAARLARAFAIGVAARQAGS